MTTLDELYDLAESLVETYQERNTLFKNIDNMYYMRWTMVDGVPDWVMPVVSTDPHDAVLTTVRTFATLKPRFKVMPLLPNEANRDKANQIETAIDYCFKQAGKRNDASVVWDVMLSASLYAEVAAQVIYLPYQAKILKEMGKEKNARMAEAAMKRYGDFAFIIHNPANIFPEWSEYGLEGVLTRRVQTVDEFIASWGKKAEKIVDRKAYLDGKISYVTSYDYVNYEKRCVWGIPTETETEDITKGKGIKIMEEENKLGFIPFAIRRWGNSLSTSSQERVMPLLQSIYDSGQWDMLNVYSSLDGSLAMRRAAKPEFAAMTPPGQDIELDYTEPTGVVKLPPGTSQFTPLPAQSVDPRVREQKAEFQGRIWQGTVARMLQSLEFPSGTAYSSVNQVLSQAVNSLSPYKILGENALAEIAYLKLCWVKYFGKEYDQSAALYGQYEDKTNMGKSVSIPWNEIPDDLQIEVILTPDMPVDRLQQINGIVMLKQNFRVPEGDLLEDLGYGNPKELAERRDQEDFNNAYIADQLTRIQRDTEMEYAQKQMEMQAGIEQQRMEQQSAMEQEVAAREQEAAMGAAANNASPAMENVEGQGFNPNMGGGAPVTAARGQR